MTASEQDREDRDFDSRLWQAKLSAMKELAYGASHEINNPLANIAARAQTLLRDEEKPERRRMLSAIHQQAMRAHEMISDLMLFARPPELVRGRMDLRSLIEQISDELAEQCQQQGIRLTLLLGDAPLEIDADSEQLAIAIKAMCTNALEAVGQDGNVQITLRQETASDGERFAVIEVLDDGFGFSDRVKNHLFDPFFSGREAGRGLGFGLSKCWRIVTDHGGTVVADAQQAGRGATFTLRLPASVHTEGKEKKENTTQT